MGEPLIKCPFCGEDDFDPIGLKDHLDNHCKNIKAIKTVKEAFNDLRKKDSNTKSAGEK